MLNGREKMSSLSIDLTTLSDEEKYQLYQALERDLGMYAISILYEDEIEETLLDFCTNTDNDYPEKESIKSAISYVINKMPAFDSDHIKEWVIEKAFEIEENRTKELVSA